MHWGTLVSQRAQSVGVGNNPSSQVLQTNDPATNSQVVQLL